MFKDIFTSIVMYAASTADRSCYLARIIPTEEAQELT